MEGNINQVDIFLEERIRIFYHKFIYYVPSAIIFEEALEQLKGNIPEDFLDEFYIIDNFLGSSIFYNEDALELNTVLADKRSFLQQNIFKLVEKSKELNEMEFLIVIEKYYEQLSLFLFITEWLSKNLKKYNGEEIHLSIIGAFNFQMQFFYVHLKDVVNYFGKYIDLEKVFDYSQEGFVGQYLPELISRYVKITDLQGDANTDKDIETTGEKLKVEPVELTERKVENSKKAKKRKRPQLEDKKIEAMILASVFNVEEKYLSQKKK